MKAALSADDRLALRLGALRRARRRQSVGEGAWAASRLRLSSVALERADAKFARDAIVRFGRALRIARMRRTAGSAEPYALPVVPLDSRFRGRWRIAAALLAAAFLVALLLVVRPPSSAEEDPASGGAAPAGGAPATASPLRGRSDQLTAVVPVVSATPAPTEAPTATPAATTAGQGTSGSSGGVGTGTVGPGRGSGAPGTASPRPTVTPTPTPAPTRTVDPNTLMFLRGRVVDFTTRRGVPFVCIAIGVQFCNDAPLTDANGFFEVPLTVGQSWDIRFIKNGYNTYLLRVTSVRSGPYTVPDIELRAR
jgi:hypothetical protein